MKVRTRPKATVYHPAVAASEPERQSLRWLLDNKAVARGCSVDEWRTTYQNVPKGPFSVAEVTMAENGPTSGAVNLRGLRCVEYLRWPNLKTADAEAEHIATLSTLTDLNLPGSDLSDEGMKPLANLKQLEQLFLDNCQHFTDRGLAHLTTLEHLYRLDIGNTLVSDEGLAHVGRINGLQQLHMGYCANLTSEGLKHLTRLPILRQLTIKNTSIDDAAVKHLKQMSCLRILWLNGTKVTASGIEELRRALPKCVIFWDGGAVIPTASVPGPDAPSSPPLAIAPFDAAQARKHQEAWAKHLGVPVEMANSVGMKLVLIPPGEFDMGSTQEEVDQLLKEAREKNYPSWYVERLPAEAPRHRVRLTKPFYLGQCEVTVGAFRRFVEEVNYKTDAEKDGKGGYGFDEKGAWTQKPEFVWRNPGFAQTDEHPVVNVSWNDAATFCQWLSRKEGKAYRLPTEAEWEHACRAGTTTRWSFGNDETALAQYAWFDGNSSQSSHPVGQKGASAWGLHDAHGNAWEWCADWLAQDYYAKSPGLDPAGPDSGESRVLRGGSWVDGPNFIRSAFRYWGGPAFRLSGCSGFRLARTP